MEYIFRLVQRELAETRKNVKVMQDKMQARDLARIVAKQRNIFQITK